MGKIIILLVVYLLSCYADYKWIQKAYYHPNGRWNHIKPTKVDVFYTFCPILNTTLVLVNIFHSPYEQSIKPEKEIEFFKPKNYKQ